MSGRIFKRLLLINTIDNSAYDGDFGLESDGRIVQFFGTLPVLIDGSFQLRKLYRSDGRTLRIRTVRCRRKDNRIVGPTYTTPTPPVIVDAQERWTQLDCSEELKFDYFVEGETSCSVSYSEVIIVDEFQNMRRRLVLDFPTEGFAVDMLLDTQINRGEFVAKTLVGDLLRAYHMVTPFPPDGDYDHNPNDVVAIKVIKHSLGTSAVSSDQLCADPIFETKNSVSGEMEIREHPMRELEIITMIANSPNHDEASCLYDGEGRALYQGHQGIIQLVDALSDSNNVYAIQPYLRGGCLLSALRSHPCEDGQARSCMRQVLKAVEFLHSLGVCHLDISCQNIMLHNLPDGSIRFVLIDFGQALVHARGVDGILLPLPPRPVGTAPGKIFFFVPETFAAREPSPFFGMPVDCWQLGILITFLVGGCKRFGGPFIFASGNRPGTPYNHSILSFLEIVAREEISGLVLTDPKGVRRMFGDIASPGCLDFVQHILKVAPEERYCIQDMLTHAWIS